MDPVMDDPAFGRAEGSCQNVVPLPNKYVFPCYILVKHFVAVLALTFLQEDTLQIRSNDTPKQP